MYGFPGKFALAIAGASLIAGCASVEDTQQAQTAAEQAQAAAAQAQQAADQALAAAQAAQQTATSAETGAQNAARMANEANARVDDVEAEQQRERELQQTAFARGERG